MLIFHADGRKSKIIQAKSEQTASCFWQSSGFKRKRKTTEKQILHLLIHIMASVAESYLPAPPYLPRHLAFSYFYYCVRLQSYICNVTGVF